MLKKDFVYLDLFSGIGGFSLALEKMGIKPAQHYFSEIEKGPIKVYQQHFPNAKGLGDVRCIKSVFKSGDIDLVTFGFPCQDLSIAGLGKGFDGERSSLFYDALRIIRETRPHHFIFENVKGLLSNDRGRTFEKVLQAIADLGIYECEWQLVNTSWLLPQNRERIYFVGHLAGKSRPKIFPITPDNIKTAGIPGQIANTITTRTGSGLSTGCYVVENQLVSETKTKPQAQRISSVRSNAVSLSANGGGLGAKTGLYYVGQCIRAVLTPERINKNQNGRRIKNNGEPSFTQTTQDRHGIVLQDAQNLQIRKLTPTECERLQGFPDGWTIGHSDSVRYKMLGNAVSVPVAQMILERLYAKE